jgi:hypothetical protein
MNFICKIVEDRPESEQIIVKFCRQNAPKSIDEYPEYAVDYDHLDFTDYEGLVYSLMKVGLTPIINQLEEEKCLPSNLNIEKTSSSNIKDNLNKIMSIDYKEIIFGDQSLKKINL